MGRLDRRDEPGSWHHVMNRGLARRTVFETASDARYFLSRVARAVRRGELEVHAFALLTTHFHMLVRSPMGRLAPAMRLIQNEHVRYFNRGRRRDGALFRGRFRSKPVETLTYRVELVRYIDHNAPQARLAATPGEYPFSSAYHYLRPSGPPWLERSWVESAACDIAGAAEFSPEAYKFAFSNPIPPGLARLVERRIQRGFVEDDPLDDLLGQAPEVVRRWMEKKAALADGTKPGLPLADAEDVDRVLESRKKERGGWLIGTGRKRVCAWRLIRVGLLRDLCGIRLGEIGAREGMPESSVRKRHRAHALAMTADQVYAKEVGELAAQALARCHEGPCPGGMPNTRIVRRLP